MKRQNLLTVVLAAAIVLFAACSGGTTAKEVSLKNETDSLNYALGLLNGMGIKETHFRSDSSGQNITAFIKAVDESFNAKAGNEIYNSGVQIGKMLKQQKTEGLDGDASVDFKQELVIQGVLNGLKGFEEGMNPQEARMYFESARQARMQQNQIPLQGFDGSEEDFEIEIDSAE